MANRKDNSKSAKKPGPRPDKLKTEGNWEDVMGEALGKKKPKEGWPDKKKPKS